MPYPAVSLLIIFLSGILVVLTPQHVSDLLPDPVVSLLMVFLPGNLMLLA